MKANNYINMTKFCDSYNKSFKNWKNNKNS